MLLARWIILLLFSLLIVLLALGLQRDPSVVSSPLLNRTVPDFTAPVLEPWESDERFESAGLRDEWSLLNVWASWCVTCLDEHELLMRLSSQIPIYGINHKDVRDDALNWLRERGNPYQRSVFDVDGHVGIELGVYKVPETFLIDPQGVIRYKHIGALTEQAWRQEMLPRIRGEHS